MKTKSQLRNQDLDQAVENNRDQSLVVIGHDYYNLGTRHV